VQCWERERAGVLLSRLSLGITKALFPVVINPLENETGCALISRLIAEYRKDERGEIARGRAKSNRRDRFKRIGAIITSAGGSDIFQSSWQVVEAFIFRRREETPVSADGVRPRPDPLVRGGQRG